MKDAKADELERAALSAIDAYIQHKVESLSHERRPEADELLMRPDAHFDVSVDLRKRRIVAFIELAGEPLFAFQVRDIDEMYQSGADEDSSGPTTRQ